jgi:carbonic anhydrase
VSKISYFDSGQPGSPWQRLLDGNARWVAGRSEADTGRNAARRAELTESQSPFALVLGCADSRLPAEIVFDQGLGDLFGVRTAGHVLDAAVLGSVEYAVVQLAVPLIVVLGHEGCGAVAAAAGVVDSAAVPPGFIRDVVEHIAPNVLRARSEGAGNSDEVGGQHTIYTIEQLRQRSAIVDGAVRRGELEIVAARYCLGTGEVSEVLPVAERARPVAA